MLPEKTVTAVCGVLLSAMAVLSISKTCPATQDPGSVQENENRAWLESGVALQAEAELTVIVIASVDPLPPSSVPPAVKGRLSVLNVIDGVSVAIVIVGFSLESTLWLDEVKVTV